MKYEEAQFIINEYGALLTNGDLRSVYPLSMLPFPKEKIKEAIKSFYTGCTVAGILEKEDKKHLEIAYKTLAAFVEDYKAKLFIDYDKWITSHKNKVLTIADAKKHNISTPESNAEMAEIQNNIRLEIDKLADEFDQLILSVDKCIRNSR